MERLARVIGPAPSEMSLGDLEQSLKREHSRVSKGLEAGAYSYGERKKKAGRAPSKAAKIKKLEEKHGIPLEEIERRLELLRKLEEKGE